MRSNEKRRVLLNALVEVFAERIARGGLGGQFDERAIREEASAAYSPPALNRPFQGKPGCFAKFGKKEHIRDTLNTGKLRVAPARSFNDPSLNDAQRDDELMHWARIPDACMEMRLYSLDSQGNEILTPFKPGNLFRGRAVSDFYVWCCAWEYDARLFHEFKSQAVIVIRDEVKFRNRFVNAMRNLLPEWDPVDGPMSYYDPLFIPHERIVPIFYKNMRFLYQNEYRFAWRSPSNAIPEQVLFPELGPLNDIAEYYEIENTRS